MIETTFAKGALENANFSDSPLSALLKTLKCILLFHTAIFSHFKYGF